MKRQLPVYQTRQLRLQTQIIQEPLKFIPGYFADNSGWTISLYGQEITKEEIKKFEIKSLTTIDGDDNVKSIDFYNMTTREF